MTIIALSQADSGRTVEASPADTITISLEENSSTGYGWELAISKPAIITVASSDHHGSGGLMGSGGTRVFTLEAANAGTTTVTLKLYRPWEGDASIVQRFEVTARVSKATS